MPQGDVTVGGAAVRTGGQGRDLDLEFPRAQHIVAVEAELTGFHLAAADLPTVYISGDNASLEVVRQIVDRLGTVDVAILNAGAAQVPYLPGQPLTLTSERAVEAARMLGASRVLPVHYTGWAHFTEGERELRAAFSAAGADHLLLLPAPGRAIYL